MHSRLHSKNWIPLHNSRPPPSWVNSWKRGFHNRSNLWGGVGRLGECCAEDWCSAPTNFPPRGPVQFYSGSIGLGCLCVCAAIKFSGGNWLGWFCRPIPYAAFKKVQPLIAVTCDNRQPGQQ
jgi:hypothetical protein